MKYNKLPFHKVDESDFGRRHMTQSNPALNLMYRVLCWYFWRVERVIRHHFLIKTPKAGHAKFNLRCNFLTNHLTATTTLFEFIACPIPMPPEI